MKTFILFISLAILFIFKANSTPVLDVKGKYLRTGVKYYARTAITDDYIGGLSLVKVRNKSCPGVVGQAIGNVNGRVLTFTPLNPKKGVIHEYTDVNIKFSGSTSCHESNVWKLKYHKAMKKYTVMVGGVEGNPGPETLDNWFKLQKVKDGYKFVFCPSVCSRCKVKCMDINVWDMYDLGRPLVFSNDSNYDTFFPYYVSFYRAN
ncbi:miraculin-like [Bidens hawaiensis]|uniref:miraculin-like n=1 Tax=Bidens hawaiensis TaxID=980011 RepID=UPI004049F613